MGFIVQAGGAAGEDQETEDDPETVVSTGAGDKSQSVEETGQGVCCVRLNSYLQSFIAQAGGAAGGDQETEDDPETVVSTGAGKESNSVASANGVCSAVHL
jgi:hypothetical protein